MNELSVSVSMSPDQIDLIKRTICKGASDDELALFLHVSKKTGLDPLSKQLYAVKRWDKSLGREVMSIQTGIDGYRVVAQRTGTYAGNDDPVFTESPGGLPRTATVTVYRMVAGQRCAFTATARWSEYVQIGKDGQATTMWRKMPYLMLGKCAEALALRKAFPAELSGVYTHDEMAQAENEPILVVESPAETMPRALPAQGKVSADPGPVAEKSAPIKVSPDGLQSLADALPPVAVPPKAPERLEGPVPAVPAPVQSEKIRHSEVKYLIRTTSFTVKSGQNAGKTKYGIVIPHPSDPRGVIVGTWDVAAVEVAKRAIAENAPVQIDYEESPNAQDPSKPWRNLINIAAFEAGEEEPKF